MTKGINQLKILTKHISCKCRCNFDGRKCNSDQCWNNCWCESKKHHYVEKIIFGIPTTCSCENRKYLASIMDDSAITGDEIIES